MAPKTLAGPLKGELQNYSIEDDVYFTLQKSCYISLLGEGFEYTLRVATDQEGKKTLMDIPISPKLQLLFDQDKQSVLWSINVPGDDEVHSLAFVFDSKAEELPFKQILAKRAFEASRQQTFEDVVKKGDEDWFLETYEQKQVELDEDEDEDMDWEPDTALSPQKASNSDKNKQLMGSMNYNRQFVLRGNQIGVFRHDNDDKLEYVAALPDLKDSRGDLLVPSEAMLHESDRKMVFLNPKDDSRVYEFDLETQKIVQEYNAMDDLAIRNITHESKYAQGSGGQTFVGLNKNSLFTMDPRISGTDKRAQAFVYKKAPNLSNAATTGKGQLAVGSELGEIRLFSEIGKRAKTLFPGLGHAITGIDTTEDGNWVLGTTEQYLLVLPVELEDGKRTGFDVSMSKKHRRAPIKLQLQPKDIAKHKIREIKFTPARFNTGENIDESWIVTSTGPFMIVWDFVKIKKGRYDAYRIKKMEEEIMTDNFRYGYADQVVVAMPDDVYTTRRQKRGFK